MVLSNKKLKQKLREAKAESLAANEFSELIAQSEVAPEGNSRLQEILDAAKQKSKLTKREKRKKSLCVRKLGSETHHVIEDIIENKSIEKEKELEGEDGSGKMKRKKERKRKTEDGESEEKGTVNEAKKTKKNKKKKKKNKNKKAEIILEEKVVAEADEVTHETEHITQSAATKIYVGGIPYYSTEDDIRSYFEGCGTVTEVDCMKFPDSGKFRGIAIIRFKTDAAAKRAMALDGSDMGGFYLKILPYKTTRTNKMADTAPKIVEGYNRIYVGNLSWDITEDDVKNFFSDCNIASIRWGEDKETGEFRGYGHVDFSDNGSLLKSLKLDQRIVCGRPIKISYAVPLKGAKTRVADSSTCTNTVNESRNDDGLNTNNVTSPTEVENGGSTAVSGKIRRRTCYECGEKGHMSTACPKKQSAETNEDGS